MANRCRGSGAAYFYVRRLQPAQPGSGKIAIRETLNKSFDKPVLSKDEGLRTNGKRLIPFVVSLSNHERNQLVQHSLGYMRTEHLRTRT